MRFSLYIIFIVANIQSYAQHQYICIVKDSMTKELLPGVNVVLDQTANGAATDILAWGLNPFE